MNLSKRTKSSVALTMLGALLCGATVVSECAFAQEAPPQERAPRNREAAPKKESAPEVDLGVDEYQRSGQVLYMQRMGKGGADRGQEIYYTKCWICHNDFTVKADPKAAPSLKGLFTRPKMITGQPVNDQTVEAQIRNGSARMPSYRAVLTDKDMSDLLAYLREKCCWDEYNPPANPRYKYPTAKK